MNTINATSCPAASARLSAPIEMSRNHPPLVPAVFDAEYRAALDAVLASHTPSEIAGAHRWMGTARDRDAGARFVARRLSQTPSPGRVVVTNGTQSALNMLLAGLVGRGNVLAVEALTYPPVQVLAERYGFTVAGVALDEHGLIPAAFEDVCQTARPRALYVLSTLQNPTTATMPLARRQAIVRIARDYDVALIEDDIYSLLPEGLPPPLSALAPELSWYVLGVAKGIASGMKVAYVVAPTAKDAEQQFWPGVRATFWMAAPLSAAIMTALIESHGADRIIAAVREETRSRQAIVEELVGHLHITTRPEALHLWIALPAGISETRMAEDARGAGVIIGASAPFVVGCSAHQAIRIGIGNPKSHEELRHALTTFREVHSSHLQGVRLS